MRVLCLLAAFVLLALPHAATAQDWKFAVSTVKPSSPDEVGSNLNFNGDGLQWFNTTLIEMVRFAYDLDPGTNQQILRAPAWMSSKRFDVNAREDEATIERLKSLSFDERTAVLRQMTQELLRERFQMGTHSESRVLPVLVLKVAKGGPKLAAESPVQDSKQWAGLHFDGHGHMEGRNTVLQPFVQILGLTREVGGRHVVDETGLHGSYDFKLQWAPEESNGSADAQGPSLFTALDEQLGLRLVPGKAPVHCVAIDRVEPPTPN
jgi:uncharacterized protein (TIGR03435 family)